MTAAGSADLVAEAEQTPFLAGAGFVADARDLGATIEATDSDAGDLVGAAIPVGLDLLGAAMNPLGTLGGAVFGWMLEHIEPLHEFLDQLAGDPAQITAQARTWHNIATELGAVADDHRAAADALGGWDGDAALAYRSAVSAHVDGVRAAAADALALSDQMLGTGARVGLVRALVRDIIADLAVRLAVWFVGVLAAAAVSFGAAVAAGAAVVVAETAATGARIVARVADLLDDLATAARAVSTTADRIGDAARFLRTGPRPPAVGMLDDVAVRATGAGADALAAGSAAAVPLGRSAASSLDEVAHGAHRTAARWAEHRVAVPPSASPATTVGLVHRAATAQATAFTAEQRAEAAPRAWGDDRPRNWSQMVRPDR